jgi:DNA-binding beta-propeller fold protein YncE
MKTWQLWQTRMNPRRNNHALGWLGQTVRAAPIAVLLVATGCGGKAIIDGEGGEAPSPSPLFDAAIVTLSSLVFDGQKQLVAVDDLSGSGYATDVVDGALKRACDVAFEGKDRVLFVDRLGTSARLVRFDLATGEIESFRPEVSSGGLVESVGAVGVDAEGRIYGVDVEGHRIFRMDDMNGSGLVTVGGGPGNGLFELDGPMDVAVFADGRIVVSDTGNDRIVVMDDMTGAGWRTWSPDAVPFDPWGVAVDDATDRIYAVGFNGSTLFRIDALDTGTPTTSAKFSDRQPSHVAVGRDGRIHLSFFNGSDSIGALDASLDLTTLTTYAGPDDEPLINPCGMAVR